MARTLPPSRQPQPWPFGLPPELLSQPEPAPLQLTQNDNISATSRYGVDAWNPLSAMVVAPGSPAGTSYHNSALRPNTLSEAEKIRIKRFGFPSPLVNDNGGFFQR